MAGRIKNGDFESWYKEWLATAERVYAIAEECLKSGNRISSREAFLRASNYYRTSEFFLHERQDDNRALSAYRMSRLSFQKACPLFDVPIEPVEFSYEQTVFKGYFSRVRGATPCPILIINGGYDTTAEELLTTAIAANQRGYNALFFDGPGQGYALREQCLYFRPYWENVISPAIDYLSTRPDCDVDKIAIIGFSLGGYFALRAAAVEKRIKACIGDGGVYDLFEMAIQKGHLEKVKAEFEKEQSSLLNWMISNVVMRASTTSRWALQDGMWKLHSSTPFEVMKKYKQYTLKSLVYQIQCPSLICDSEDDIFSTTQSHILFEHLACPKKLIRFIAEEGASAHCQEGAKLLSHQRIFDWLSQVMPV